MAKWTSVTLNCRIRIDDESLVSAPPDDAMAAPSLGWDDPELPVRETSLTHLASVLCTALEDVPQLGFEVTSVDWRAGP